MSKIEDFICKSYSLLEKDSSESTKKNIYNECNSHLNVINKNLTSCIDMFNTLLIDMARSISENLPNDKMMSVYYGTIKEIVRSKPREPITLFITNVYINDEYKTSIENGDDDFFIKKEYDEIDENDTDSIEALFQFKSCWKKVKPKTQNTIKETANMFLNICDRYVISKDNGNNLAKLILLVD